MVAEPEHFNQGRGHGQVSAELVVVGVQLSLRKGVGAGRVFGSASLVGLHILSVPELGSSLGVV